MFHLHASVLFELVTTNMNYSVLLKRLKKKGDSNAFSSRKPPRQTNGLSVTINAVASAISVLAIGGELTALAAPKGTGCSSCFSETEPRKGT